ncbi:hypothetical protein J7T55_011662 [Diaporthe amygdali]|uniref:uncharacterized protein n=1 Tax=Phomopsis amygdali TaxID=1214568 RepID=UPI0022FEF591|nr:uncharacterized protein J7T55_011662 [Diaporthe amygdali]KAJ0123198.1 hypothetical protein J7T55_011662 [Diaporthe amygdali]
MLPNTPRQRSFAQALTPPHDPETKPPNTPRLQRSFVQWMTPPNDPETKPHLSPSFPSRIRRDSEQYEPKGQIGKEALDAMPSSKSGLSELLQIEDCGRDTHSVISSNEGYSVRLVHQDSTAVHNPSINPYSDGWNYRASPAPQAFDMLVDNTIPIPPSPLGLYLGNSLYIPPSPLRTPFILRRSLSVGSMAATAANSKPSPASSNMNMIRDSNVPDPTVGFVSAERRFSIKICLVKNPVKPASRLLLEVKAKCHCERTRGKSKWITKGRLALYQFLQFQ